MANCLLHNNKIKKQEWKTLYARSGTADTFTYTLTEDINYGFFGGCGGNDDGRSPYCNFSTNTSTGSLDYLSYKGWGWGYERYGTISNFKKGDSITCSFMWAGYLFVIKCY